MDTIRDLTIISAIIRILLAVILGGIIGLERGLKNHPAGLRTYILVCMGSCIIMITNQYVYQTFEGVDPVRMGAQVISGIGFLGAGTIIVTSKNQIRGLTTAAGLWTTACVGLTLGIGLYEVAVIGGIIVFVVLTLLNKLDYYLRYSRREIELYIELDRNVSLSEFIRELHRRGIKASNFQLENNNIIKEKEITFITTLKSGKKLTCDEIVKVVMCMKGVLHIEEL